MVPEELYAAELESVEEERAFQDLLEAAALEPVIGGEHAGRVAAEGDYPDAPATSYGTLNTSCSVISTGLHANSGVRNVKCDLPSHEDDL